MLVFLLTFSSCLLSAVLWTGEVWDFLGFTERHPSIIYNILLFGLTSALGQVGGKLSGLVGDDRHPDDFSLCFLKKKKKFYA